MKTAADICAVSEFKGKGMTFFEEGLSPPQFFDLLVEEGCYPDAIRFLSHALPKRLAVWWGCLCLWHFNRPEPPAPVAAVLQAAVRWVQDPSEEHRRAAEAPGRAAQLDTPAGCLAMAVFWSGGSMGPAQLPAIPPPEVLTGKMVAGAVLLAAAHGPNYLARIQQRREFLAVGREVLLGTNHWTNAAPAHDAPAPSLHEGHGVTIEAAAEAVTA